MEGADIYTIVLRFDTLEHRHPQSAWVKNLQAFTLMMDRRGPEAKLPLAKVLEHYPIERIVEREAA